MIKRTRKGGFFGRFFKKEEELNPYTGIQNSKLEPMYKEQCKKHLGFIKNKTTKCKNMEKAIKMNIEKASALASMKEINRKEYNTPELKNKGYDQLKEFYNEKKNNNPVSKEEEDYFVLDVNMSNLNDDDKNKIIRMYPLLVFDYTKAELDTNPAAVKAKVIQFFKQFIANNDPEEYEYTKEELINNPNQVIQKVKDIDDHKNRAYYVSEKMTEDEDEDEDEPEEIDYRKWRDVGFEDDLNPEQNYSSKPMDNNYDLRPDMSLTTKARGGKRRTKKHLQKRSMKKRSMKKRSIRKSRKQRKR